jgi:hypothetical protein
MILELVRSLTDWLNDGSHGLVAQFASIPRDAGDPQPNVGTIADETRNILVAQSRLPSLPGIAVNVQQMPMLDGEVEMVTRDGEATILFRYGVAAEDSQNAIRDTSYVLRAGIRSLRFYNTSANQQRNSIQIYNCRHLAIKPLWAPVGDQIVTGAIIGTWSFRDIAP